MKEVRCMGDVNNIFDFATKELSQDAVICWMLNWIKYPKSELYDLAKDMFSLLGEKDVDYTQKIDIKTQFKKADIVIVFHDKRKIIIIEDKLYSSEHSNQMERYKKIIAGEDVQRELKIEGEAIPEENIKVVYFKTGYLYDIDKLIKNKEYVNVIITGKKFWDVIKKYENNTESEILKSYILHLKGILKYYEDYGAFTRKYDDGGYYISWEYISQHRFMREIFPEEKWDGKSDKYMVKNGSSSGRPWTEMSICEYKLYDGNNGEGYSIFWRVDSNNKGPYLSLRIYEEFDKNKSEKLNRHKEIYNKYLDIIRKIVEKNGNCIVLKWEDIKDGYRGSYKESSLLSIQLSSYLDNWDFKGDQLINDVRFITDEFVKRIE